MPKRPPVLWIVVAVALSAVFAWNAVAPTGKWLGLTEDLVGVGAAVGMWIGLHRRRLLGRTGWPWLAAALSCWVIGDLVWDAYTFLGLQRPDVSIADVLYLAGYPFVVIGLMCMVRRRAAGRAREGLLDGVGLAIGAAILSWHFVIVPLVRGAQSTVTAVVWAAYPFLDVLVLAAFAWLAFMPGRRSRATKLLLAALGVTLLADALYSALPIWWTSFDVARLDPLYPLSYVLLMGAALDRNAAELTTPVRNPTIRMPAGRVVLLGASLATVPLVVSAQGHGTALASRVFVLCASFVLCAVVLARLVFAVRERERVHIELAHRATHDDLTGLVNRTLLLDRIQAGITRSEQADESLVAFYVDVDRFKAINDTWGHSVGDAVLVEIGNRLRATVRSSDTVARVGGDEFVVVCEEMDGRTAHAMARRIADMVAIPIELGEVCVRATASIGIAYGGAGQQAEQLVRESDAAMYITKRAGHGGIGVFDAELQAASDARREMELALITALGNHELEAVYQPIFRLGTDSLIGFEALARWELPGVGPVAPSEFIALAEDAGLIGSLGEWMLEQACRQIVEWDSPSTLVSVNVSAKQFANGELERVVQRVLIDTGADPARLVLEVTESVLIADMKSALEQLAVVTDLGVKIAIDDFGTGYSGLSYLQQFPITIVKLDRSFLKQELSETTTPVPRVVTAVVQLAHALGYTVIAEGVETEEQRSMLSACGCDWAQGFYFAPPLALSDATNLAHGRALSESHNGAFSSP